MLDWDKPITQSLAQGISNTLRQSSGITEGSLSESTGGRKDAKDRLELVREALKQNDANSELAEEILAGAASGLNQVAAGELPATFRQLAGLEAVVLTDGTRPSFTVQNGYLDSAAPLGEWSHALRNFETNIRAAISAVGRINVPVNPLFAGTVFVIAPGIVATNRHVLEAIARQTEDRWRLNWPDATGIDFIGEAGNETKPTFEIADVLFVGPDPIEGQVYFPHLDLAIFKVKPIGDAKCPQPVDLDFDANSLGLETGLCAIGFPARPRIWVGDGPPPPSYEIADILSTVFSNSFGVKKIAPGRVNVEVGQLQSDNRKWVFSHDASTLSGNSGSLLLNLDLKDGKCLGIHFAGIARKENYAHSFAALSHSLRTAGLSNLIPGLS